ncbi:FAD-dependent oxidoreductase [Curtobacterium sp. MCBD17_013]|uniref:NAD(P)/FAD-dependent oxidoreductase n=1 Tax=Curtobacterium sp. MCBD17_013 TaxID=2175668 RepID=UPI000DA81B84|nr:FAD-dependent oxidoreductase [Curtobacterium sp. MCBD17_013]PZF64471.1 FAD-dependent oxidoreductase [Curtobacterium sp. MCBD17_013]
MPRSDTTATALVIGAGIAGAATAFALARRGVAVTVVDDGATGQATAASAGILQPWSSAVDGPFLDLYAAGAAFYPNLLAQLAGVGVTRTDHRRSGALVVNADPALLDAAEARVRSRAAVAGSVVGAVERITNAEARRRFPPLAAGLDALFIEGGGRVDGRTLRDALLLAAERLGAVRRGGHVRSVRVVQGRPLVDVDGADTTADVVVVAAGAWSRDLLASTGAAVPVAPQRGQITHLRVEGVDTSAWPSVHPLSHHYLVAFDDSRVAVGATRETGSGFDPRVTAAGQLQVLQDALAVAPGLADATLIETRVGLRPLPDDTMPVVGALPGTPGVVVATGYGAAGLTMGPLLGDAVARWVLGEPAPELEHTAPGRAGVPGTDAR